MLNFGDPQRAVTAERFVNDVLGLERRRHMARWVGGLLALAAAALWIGIVLGK